MVQEVLDVMIELAQEDITMICVTHEMGFARQVADRVIFMEDGRIRRRARPSTSSITPRTRAAASSCPRFCTRRGDGHDGYDEGGRVAPSLLQLAGAGMLALTGTALTGCGNSTSGEGSDKGSSLRPSSRVDI